MRLTSGIGRHGTRAGADRLDVPRHNARLKILEYTKGGGVFKTWFLRFGYNEAGWRHK